MDRLDSNTFCSSYFLHEGQRSWMEFDGNGFLEIWYLISREIGNVPTSEILTKFWQLQELCGQGTYPNGSDVTGVK